jgi:archaellum component FlaF (FlaF/FlaG flagellin family)
MADEMEGCIGGLIGFAFIAAAVILAIMALVSVGSVFGAGTAIKNYYLAFRRNVQPERVGA